MISTRYVAIVAVFLHGLLCGNGNCCATTCSPKDDAAAVSQEPLCPCHSEKQDAETESDNFNGNGSNYDCDHQHHFCQCLQSAPLNTGTGFRVILTKTLFSLPVAFLSVTSVTPKQVPGHCTLETMCHSSALGVRLHLLLEHFLI